MTTTRQAVIFDLDGVLVDTAALHAKAWERLAHRYGLAFDDSIEPRLRGVSRMASLAILLEGASRSFSESEKAQMADEKNADYKHLIETLSSDDLLPGARRALESSREAGLKVALGSASRNAEAVIARLGIAPLFDYVVDAGAVENGKPAPDIFLDAANGLGVPAAACVGVEDAQAGVQAIRRAGMKAIGVGEETYLHEADLLIPAIASYDPCVLP